MILMGSFLAGAIISLLIPIGVFLAILVWHLRAFGRVPGGERHTEPPSAERSS